MTSASDTMWDVAEDSLRRDERGELTKAREGRVLIVTLNRPDSLNALTPHLHQQLLDALREAATDKEVGAVLSAARGVRSVRVVTCVVPKLRRSRTRARGPAWRTRADSLLHHGETARLLHTMPKPTIAMINGVAARRWPRACTRLRHAVCRARRDAHDLVRPRRDVGRSRALAISLTQLVGSARARELMFTGDKISAEEALRIGLGHASGGCRLGFVRRRLHMAARWRRPGNRAALYQAEHRQGGSGFAGRGDGM